MRSLKKHKSKMPEVHVNWGASAEATTPAQRPQSLDQQILHILSNGGRNLPQKHHGIKPNAEVVAKCVGLHFRPACRHQHTSIPGRQRGPRLACPTACVEVPRKFKIMQACPDL